MLFIFFVLDARGFRFSLLLILCVFNFFGVDTLGFRFLWCLYLLFSFSLGLILWVFFVVDIVDPFLSSLNPCPRPPEQGDQRGDSPAAREVLHL